MTEKKYKFIEPEEIPKVRRIGDYDRIINEFLESGLESARVTYEKEAKTLVLGLQNRMRARGLKDQVKARKIGDNVYLQKLK